MVALLLLTSSKKNTKGTTGSGEKTKTMEAPSSADDLHLPRGVSASTTGVFALDVLALATMAACVPTLRLFVAKRRHWNLVRCLLREGRRRGVGVGVFLSLSLSTTLSPPRRQRCRNVRDSILRPFSVL